MSTAIARYQFTVADYERMIEVGIFAEDDRVELLGGEIIAMSPIGHQHVQAVNVLGHLLYAAAGTDLTVSIQNPIQLGPHDEPQPDLAVLRGVGQGLANASEVLLIIEVADSSRESDRTLKLPRYAAAGIPEAWLIDLGAETVERHTEPRDGYYRFAAFAMRGDTLASTVLPALTISADVVLGPLEG
jgi:Uma2 family endonuclease